MYKVDFDIDLEVIIDVFKEVDISCLTKLKKIVRKTADNMAHDARKNIKSNSYKTGALHNSINVNARHSTSKIEATIKANANHGVFIEEGTRAHIIKPKSRKALMFNSGGKTVFAKYVNHPGTKAKPFMRPAFEKNVPLFIKELEDAINGND